jgi:hypothetical protein
MTERVNLSNQANTPIIMLYQVTSLLHKLHEELGGWANFHIGTISECYYLILGILVSYMS